MDTEDVIVIAAVAAVAWLMFRRRAPVATVTTSETYTLPLLDVLALDINSGLYALPMPMVNQGIFYE